jgi:flagellar assembly protein FliH
MNTFIPKERTGAYQPWKLTSLEGGPAAQATAQTEAQAQKHARESAERLKVINQQAYRQGFDAGYAKGAAQAAAEAQRLAALVGSAQQEVTELEQRVAEDLVRLALMLARSLVRESLKVHPEIIEATVRETVRDMPPLGLGARLRLHPEDAALLSVHLGKELGADWTIVEDNSITRGGCRIESATCEIDATLETRWQKVCAALAQDHQWIA